MLKIVSTVALVLMFLLMIPAGLITISQDAAKGDWNYPIKAGIEDVILSVASLTPYTKAYFAVALANRRYAETEKLLALGEDADTSLQELVAQTTSAANDIGNVSSSQQRARLIADLSGAIEKYDKGLENAQVSIDTKSELNSKKNSPAPLIAASAAPVSRGSATPTPRASNRTPPENSQQNPQQAYNPALDQALRDQREAIDRTRRELEELRRKLELEQTSFQQPLYQTPLPTSKSFNPPSLPPIQTSTPKPSPSPSSNGYGAASDSMPVVSPSVAPSYTPAPSVAPTYTPEPSVSLKKRTSGQSFNDTSGEDGSGEN